MNVFREIFEKTQRRYEKVIKVKGKFPMCEIAADDENNKG